MGGEVGNALPWGGVKGVLETVWGTVSALNKQNAAERGFSGLLQELWRVPNFLAQ